MNWERIEDFKPPKNAIDDRWTWRASPDPLPSTAHHAAPDQDRSAPAPDEDLRHTPATLPPG